MDRAAPASPATLPAATLPAVALVTAVLLAGCTASGAAPPALGLAALRARLVTTHDVDLPGWTRATPDGEQQAHTATAVTYFTAGFRQLSVTLTATASPAAARAVAAAALTTAALSLRSTTASGGVDVGRTGRPVAGQRVAGRTKGDGALQETVEFVEGSVAVGVTLSSSTPDQPAGVAVAVARAQDARLTAGA